MGSQDLMAPKSWYHSNPISENGMKKIGKMVVSRKILSTALQIHIHTQCRNLHADCIFVKYRILLFLNNNLLWLFLKFLYMM